MVLHGTADQLQRTLEDHCALAYPTASRATWDRTLEANWNKGIVHLGFTLDNAARTRVGVDYDLAAGAYMVSVVAVSLKQGASLWPGARRWPPLRPWPWRWPCRQGPTPRCSGT